MPLLGIYSWSQYSTPPSISNDDLLYSTTPNDPTSPSYVTGMVSWVGEPFTFNGGAPETIEIIDDDGDFQDGYVETGGAQTLAQGITIDGTYYPAGSTVENEFSLVDAGGQEIYVVRINGENVGFSYGNGEAPTVGDTFTASQGLDGSPADNADGTSTSQEPYANVICFAAGVHIDTLGGPKCVETLRCGDSVRTQDAGFQPVVWIGKSAVVLSGRSSNIRPVLISAGSLGDGLPRRDLIVSQQHRILVGGAFEISGRHCTEVFVPAKGLLPLPGVRLMLGKKLVEFYHLLLPLHSVVFGEGAPCESFYPGRTALTMMTAKQRREVLTVCPALKPESSHAYGAIARPSLSVKEGQDWARTMRGQQKSDRQDVAAERV